MTPAKADPSANSSEADLARRHTRRARRWGQAALVMLIDDCNDSPVGAHRWEACEVEDGDEDTHHFTYEYVMIYRGLEVLIV